MTKCEKYLMNLGAPMSAKGFGYIVEAVDLIHKEPDLINKITRELLPRIADAYGTTWIAVERNIRKAIMDVYDRNANVPAMFVPDPQKGKLTNKEFLARLARVVSDEES